MNTTNIGVTFDQVEKVAGEMLAKGIKPTVRGLMQVIGGKTETVTKHLRDFNDKRDAEVSKMADELGSSEIAKLLASEVQLTVDRRTLAHKSIIDRMKADLAETIELLDEKENECQHRISLAEAKTYQAVTEADKKITQAAEQVKNADEKRHAAESLIQKTIQETSSQVQAEQQKAQMLVASAQERADALINAANERASMAEAEAKALREQVKLLTIDEAKRELELEQYEAAQHQISELRNKLTEQGNALAKLQSQNEQLKDERLDLKVRLQQAIDNIGTETSKRDEIRQLLDETKNTLSQERSTNAQLNAEKIAVEKDNNRINNELMVLKDKASLLSELQAQLVESQKQLSQLRMDLTQSEREREMMSQALAVSASSRIQQQ
jgi:hypothetical protein